MLNSVCTADSIPQKGTTEDFLYILQHKIELLVK